MAFDEVIDAARIKYLDGIGTYGIIRVTKWPLTSPHRIAHIDAPGTPYAAAMRHIAGDRNKRGAITQTHRHFSAHETLMCRP